MRSSNEEGFTLVELLVALAISGIISAAMYSAYIDQQRVKQAQDQVVVIQQNLRAGLEMMVREFRMAGYDPDKKWGAGFTEASESAAQFTLVEVDDGIDNDGDGAIDEAGELKTVRFGLYDGYGDGDTDLGRTADGVGPAVLMENVDNLEFFYTLDDKSRTLKPTPDDIANDRIRSIQISVLARASEQSRGYLNTATYTSASGVDWTPTPDRFRRRMQVITVYCRNMGW